MGNVQRLGESRTRKRVETEGMDFIIHEEIV